jgi:hypothetical protein
MIVKSRATSVTGEIFGMKTCSYHAFDFHAEKGIPGDHAGKERDAEVDEDALRNLDYRDRDAEPAPMPSRGGRYVMKNHA